MTASLKQVVAICALMISPKPALAEPTRVFPDAAACVASGAYGALDCGHAERNARAEFNEKAPRFPARSACERVFTRCMIGEISRGGIDFIPTPRGFAIVSGPRAGVLPVLEGGDSQGLFERRRIDRDDAGVHRGLTRNAVAISPANPPRKAAPDAELSTGAGGLQAYPLPAAALRDLRERERKFGGSSDDR